MQLTTFAARNLMALVLLAAPAALTGCAVDGTEDPIGQSDEQDITQKAGKFEMFQGQDGNIYFHLLAANGQKVLASEGYGSWSAAAQGIASCQANGVDAASYELLMAKNGQWYFNLKAANGEIVGTSELYATQSNAERAVTVVSTIVAKTVQLGNAPTGAPRFVTFQGLDGKYYFHLRAKNGEIVLQSQAYSSKSAAQKGVSSVALNGQTASNFEVLPAADGQYYFVLRAQNKQIVGVGETYASKWNAQHGVDAIVILLATGGAQQPQ